MYSQVRGLFALLLIAGTAHVAMAQGKSQVQAVPNVTKYKSSGVKPGTGRSGSATLEARALLAKDGSMLLEASTGSVETGAGPGQIAKTQIKINALTKNFNNLTGGGYWAGTFPGLTRNTPVQVQANIRGIDPKRTGVVTVTTPALLRPDVSVTAVNGPSTHQPQLPIEFVATVVEKNGDVGARANCVFSVNGTESDIANGIWVDAGGTVACQFSHTFDAPGTYTIGVAATGVVPGDWDSTNNSATTTITIVEPGRAIKNGYMEAYQHSYIDEYLQEYRANVCDEDWWTCSYRYEQVYRQNYSTAYMSGWAAGASPRLQRLDAELYANGAIQHQASLTPNQTYSYDYGDYYYSCDQFYQDVWDGTRWVLSADRFGMCTNGYRSNPASGSTSYWYQFITGDVVYYGAQTYCGTWGCNTYTWQNWAYRYGNGADLGWTSGTEVRLKLAFVDETGARHTADKSVTLQGSAPEDFRESSDWNDGYWNYTYVRRYYRAWASGWINWND